MGSLHGLVKIPSLQKVSEMMNKNLTTHYKGSEAYNKHEKDNKKSLESDYRSQKKRNPNRWVSQGKMQKQPELRL